MTGQLVSLRLAGRLAAGMLAVVLVCAGCEGFKPLSLDWPWGGQSPRPAAGGQNLARQHGPATQPGERPPADVQAGQEDLARQVQDYASRLAGRLEGQPRRAGVRPAMARMPGPGAGLDAPGEVIGSPPPPPRADLSVESAGPPSTAPESAGRTQPPAVSGRTIGETAGDRPAPPVEQDNSPPVVLTSGPGVPGLLSSGQAVAEQPRPAAAGQGGLVALPAVGAPSADALAETIAQAEKAAAAQPADFRAQLQLRMLYLAAGRVGQAKGPWPAGSAREQQLLSTWVEAAVALADVAGQPDGRVENSLTSVERLRSHLADQAALKIRTIRLVSRVDGFGVVAPFDADAYRPGQWVIVYCELDNLTSRVDTDGQHRTELAFRVELLSAEGKSVLCQEDPQVVDRSLNHRRDFFLARRLRLPATMPAGQYVLRVSVEDKQAAKVGESMLKFQVK